MSGFRSDMDRAFELTIASLHLSERHEAAARLFYADGLNNRAAHLTPYMASRVIAGVFAALAALKAERNAVVRYINDCADAFSGVPVATPIEQRGEAYRYSLDAVLRYHSLADHISERAHVSDSDKHPKGENAQRLSGEAMPARAEGIAQPQSPLTPAIDEYLGEK